MKLGLYPRLALTGIQKNRKLYLPYILTSIGIIMMFYIVSFLSSTPRIAAMPGGRSMHTILSLGTGVIGFFALVFLFYTNSFLIRKRKKEFGLYNILGMGKQNIARILAWESLFIAAFALMGGLFCGILFSKAGELIMIHMLGGQGDFTFTVSAFSIVQTLVLFTVIFVLILLNALRQIHLSKPVELLRSDSVGEKPPKSNWVFALLGVVILAGAYYLALSVKDPLLAMLWFFVAVIMVILASYLLFIAGSVVFCRLLQKNKGYYYKPNHFVSVSSMVYRMKRNGAGLASICILSTMVLVMLSSTVCLYIGVEDSLRTRYPQDMVVDIYSAERSHRSALNTVVENALKKNGLQQRNVQRYRYLYLTGYLQGDAATFELDAVFEAQDQVGADIRQFFIIPLEDYNQLTGENEVLAADEVMLYSTKVGYEPNTIILQGLHPMKIKKVVPEFVKNNNDAMQMIPSMFVIVPEFTSMEALYEQHIASAQTHGYQVIHSYYCFDLSGDMTAQIALEEDVRDAVSELQLKDDQFPLVGVEGMAPNRAEFYGLYGGLFFLGVLLGIVFILGAVLIMYYKQISEGYEDQGRFAIMQKVGMTRREIKKSVNSQVLTVFFLPLAAAGVHIIFAFPMISKLLALFNLVNTQLFVIVTVCCYLIFTLFYILVYLFTSRTYYRIVSERDEA